MNDFDAAVNIYKAYITSVPSARGPSGSLFNISTMQTDDKGTRNDGNRNKNGGGKNNATVEDRYYSNPEYNKLTSEQKLQLKRLREARGGGQKKGKRAKGSEEQTLSRMISAAVTKGIAAAKDGKADDDNTEEEEESVSNRNNPALTRQKKNTGKK